MLRQFMLLEHYRKQTENLPRINGTEYKTARAKQAVSFVQITFWLCLQIVAAVLSLSVSFLLFPVL